MTECMVCKSEPMVVGSPLCRNCRAEIVLTHGKSALESAESLYKVEDGKVRLSVETMDKATGIFARAVKCEACNKAEIYDPTVRKKSYFCDECGKQLCVPCAAYCIHKDWGTIQKVLCKNCRAERSLTGLPVEEVEGSLPGQEKDGPKREPKPHCARATCSGEFCGCECAKCREAVASGFMEPMFGKQAPDPDPEPEPAEDDSDEEEEIARAEGSQP